MAKNNIETGNIETGFFPDRFAISAEGMGELNKDRFERLIYELIQNVFDEDSATLCSVSVHDRGDEGARIVVKDDGEGFAEPRDAWQVNGPNPKRGMPEKRGMFNMGTQQAVSAAIEAKVATVGYTVEFPSSGGRFVRRNRRKRGTEVMLVMPWDAIQTENMRQNLRLVRPPAHCRLTMNGREVDHLAPVKVHEATLETVIQEGPGMPMRRTRRKTRMEIYRPCSTNGKGWIFDQGMPVQEIDSRFDVNVMQKIPQNPNRDTVSEAYLQDIYAELLNAVHSEMKRDEFSETWVRTAVEDTRISEDAARATVQNRLGENAVLWSSSRNANLEAIDKGYHIVHPRTMSREEREHLQERGGLESASARFGGNLGDNDNPHFRVVDVSGDADKLAFESWVKEMGSIVGAQVNVQFIHNTRSFHLADCTRDSSVPTMRFNLARLNDEFFVSRGSEQLGLVIHELGHAVSNGDMAHGYKWGDACAYVGAEIVLKLLQSVGVVDFGAVRTANGADAGE